MVGLLRVRGVRQRVAVVVPAPQRPECAGEDEETADPSEAAPECGAVAADQPGGEAEHAHSYEGREVGPDEYGQQARAAETG
jgi:hypothetical protein